MVDPDPIEVWTRNRHLLWDDHVDGYEVGNAGDALVERVRQLEAALRRIATEGDQADWYYADIARAALGDPKETDGR